MTPLRRQEPPAPDPAAGDVSIIHDHDAIVGLLTSADPEVRRRAAIDLGDRAEDAARPHVLTALIERVGVEADRTVRAALLGQLARYDRIEVVEGLLPHLASDDAALRMSVVETLSRTPTSSAARIPALLADPDPDVRMMTVMVIAGLPVDGVEAWLTDVVLHDDNANVAAAAVGELLPLAGVRAEGPLIAVRGRFPQDPFIHYVVSRALRTIRRGRS